MRCARSVEPTRSQNSTVICRRELRAAADSAGNEAPHAAQKRPDGGVAAWQRGQGRGGSGTRERWRRVAQRRPCVERSTRPWAEHTAALAERHDARAPALLPTAESRSVRELSSPAPTAARRRTCAPLDSLFMTLGDPPLTVQDDALRRALGARYRLEREVGRGGAALVFLAQDLKHDRPVAVKILRPEISASLGAERFLREI